MSSRLCTITPYGRGGASSRVRVFDWLAHEHLDADSFLYTDGRDHSAGTLLGNPLRTAGRELTLRKYASKRAGRRVLLSRSTSPFSSGEVERKILTAAGLGVYDFDDALYADSSGRGLRRFFPKAEVWKSAVRAADRVIAGNAVLAERASQFARDVRIIPSCVNPDDYCRKLSYEVHEVPQIVWVGSPSTETHLAGLAMPLRWAREQLGARLTVVSSGREAIPGLEGLMDRVDWSPTAVHSAMVNADIAIAPLRDDEYARGKCAYKLLQYGAAGMPVIASPVGENARAVALMGGLAPKGGDEWRDALSQLLTEIPDVRTRRGGQAADAVRDHYSFNAWSATWRRAVGEEV